METNKKLSNWIVSFNLKLSLIYVGIALFLGFSIILIVFNSKSELEELGLVGDFMGGLMNPLIGISAALLTFLAFWVQFQANQDIRNQFKLQQFENQFFEMLRLYKDNVNEMKIQGYDNSISQEMNPNNIKDQKIIRSRVYKEIVGRKVFVVMYEELKLCLEVCNILNRKLGLGANTLHQIAFDIFFFGIDSTYLYRNFINEPEDNFKKILEVLTSNFRYLREQHDKNNGESTKYKLKDSDETVEIKLKYLPFYGHENKLGHYYRHLFYTVKYVVKTENNDLIDYDQAREYLKLLRAQMSNYEQVILYYNYIIGYGNDWENEGFLTKYRMLHNLPLNKIKYVRPPRQHFEEFIKTIKPEETSMFEWGDYEHPNSNFY